MSSSLGVGGALGLPLAALIAEHANWHALFWLSATLGAVAITLVLKVVPESRGGTGGRFDLTGAVGLSTALICLLLAISKGADWGWDSGLTLGLFGTAAGVFVVWGWWELRARQPLLDLRTCARRPVLITNLASIALGFAMFAMRLVYPQVLQLPTETGYGLGESMLVVGLVMAPQGLVMMAISPLSARLSSARGPKVTLMIGAAIVAFSYAVGLLTMSQLWQFVLISCINGVGIGFAYGAMPALIMGAVPVSETGAANSLNTLMRGIGSASASAVAGVILAYMTITVGETVLPSLDGFRGVMVVGCAASLLAAAIMVIVPRRSRA